MSTLKQRLDNIILGLRVIARIQPKQRPLFKDKSISVRSYYWPLTPLLRRSMGESRLDVLNGMNEFVDDVNRLVDDYLNSSELQTLNLSTYDRETASTMIMSLNRLKVELPHAYDNTDKGLRAIIKTYDDGEDLVTPSRLEGVIDNLKATTRRLTIALDALCTKFTVVPPAIEPTQEQAQPLSAGPSPKNELP